METDSTAYVVQSWSGDFNSWGDGPFTYVSLKEARRAVHWFRERGVKSRIRIIQRHTTVTEELMVTYPEEPTP